MRLYDFFDGTHRPWWALAYLTRLRKDWVGAYETSLAQASGVPFAVTFGAGRMAFYAILEAMNIGPGDEVILPAYTCVVVPNAVLYRGARPVYVDIDPDTFNIDPSRLETAVTPLTKAIVAQHTYGQPCDLEAILSIARRRGVAVIEDCAHSFGATWNGRPLGSLGDAAFVSTDHTKVLSTSVGGFVLCKSETLAQKIRAIQRRCPALPWHALARIWLQYLAFTFLYHPRAYRFARPLTSWLWVLRLCFYFRDELSTRRPPAYPVPLSRFQAFVGLRELRRLGDNIAHRRSVARRYQQILRHKMGHLETGAFLRYSLLVKSPDLWSKVLGRRFTVGRWFLSVVHGRETALEEVGYRPGSCPQAERAVQQVINFPTHFWINEAAIRQFETLVESAQLWKDVLIPPRVSP